MDYYILRLEESNLIVEGTFIEAENDERYILFGESDPNRYPKLLATAIIKEFQEFNLVIVTDKI